MAISLRNVQREDVKQNNWIFIYYTLYLAVKFKTCLVTLDIGEIGIIKNNKPFDITPYTRIII